MQNAVSREAAGTVVRTTLRWIQQAGFEAKVRARVGRQALAQFDRPPLPIAWVAGPVLDELLEALEGVGGPQKVVGFGAAAARTTLGGTASSIVTAIRSMYGDSPGVLFSRMGALTELLFRGVGFEWKADGRHSGVLTVRTPDAPKVAWFRAWEGFIQYLLELSGAEGAPTEWTLMPDGRTAYFAMAWWERPSRSLPAVR